MTTPPAPGPSPASLAFYVLLTTIKELEAQYTLEHGHPPTLDLPHYYSWIEANPSRMGRLQHVVGVYEASINNQPSAPGHRDHDKYLGPNDQHI